MTGDEWEQSQYAPHRLDTQPTQQAGPGRILTGDEWEAASRAPDVRALQFPALPKFASDATQRLNPNAGAPDRSVPEQMGAGVRNIAANLDIAAMGLDPTSAASAHVLAALARQAVAPAVEHPLLTAALANPVGAVIGTGMAVSTIAQYGWQKAHALVMSRDERARSEADPGRVSGEAAAVQAVMLGLGGLAAVHALPKGLAALDNAADISGGVMESATSAMAREGTGTAPVPGSVRIAQLFETAKTAAQTPLEVPAVPEVGLRPEREPFYIPKVGQAEEFPVVPKVGRGQEATPLTTEQRAGKPIPPTEPQTYSSPEPGPRIPKVMPRQRPSPLPLFETEKGADLLGTVAAQKGLPETASPYPPGTSLDQAWVEGHASTAVEPVPQATEPVAAQPSEPTTGQGVEAATEPASGPSYRGPTPLYARLSNDALTAEYRSLFEKRTAEEPNAVAPLWTPEREARAVEQIENRRRPDGSLSAAEKRALTKLQAEHGESYYVGRHTFESAAAEKRVGNLTRHITAIEAEMDKRGINPVDVLQQQPTAAGSGLTPVEGTGEVKTRGLAAGVEQTAIAHDLTDYLGDLPEYRQVNMEDQAGRSVSLLSKNPDLARRIALGEAQAPEGLLPESVFVAVERQAIAEGDVTTIRDLASGRLTEQATTMGQRIRALGEREPDSPVTAIQQVAEARGGKNAGKSIAEAVRELKAHIASTVQIDEASWAKFIDSLRC